MRFLSRSQAAERFDGKTVAIVGSGPGALSNRVGVVDGHDVVVRVNNYRLYPETGYRTDVFYSFFGRSIKKTRDELIRDGVTLCMSKTPNADIAPFLSDAESAWHRRNGKMIGIDYRPHYQNRADWWFCDTYVPTVEEFFAPFDALGRHQPTTGFAAIFDVFSFKPQAVHLTGFDFFRSGVHNVNEPWIFKNPDDPIRHMPERELAWLRSEIPALPFHVTFDPALSRIMREPALAA